MLNLDSAEEREVITGCCGGVRTEITLPATPVAAAGIGARVFLSGLSGGHSGEDINKGRGNAHILMGRLLKALGELTPFRLCSLSGGDKDNAIPRECEAIVLVESREALSAFAAQANVLLASFLTATEDGKASVSVTEVSVSAAYSEADSAKMLSVLGIDNGVLAYYEGEQMPRTSRNLAKISSEADGVVFGFSSRSANESELDGSCESLDALAASIGGTTRHFSRYPGWESAGETALCRDWQAAYAKVSGNSARATVIHAGLECGLITASLKGMQAISDGCNIFDLHTPQERVELDSFDRIYQTLLAFLAGK
jgi:dipeptidase D